MSGQEFGRSADGALDGAAVPPAGYGAGPAGLRAEDEDGADAWAFDEVSDQG